VQAGGVERGGALGEREAVGRHGDVFVEAERRQPRHKLFHTWANQRLAAGDANLAQAEPAEDAAQAQQLRPG